MATWDDIKNRVEANGNVLSITMEDLRLAHGAGKLGVNVRSEISSALQGSGLGHVPTELPTYSHELVRLYKFGTPVGQMIANVMSPGQQNDEKLVGQFSGAVADHVAIVQKIRELVAE